MQETKGLGANNALNWSTQIAAQADALGKAQVWLHLQVEVTLAQTCQRCLQQMAITLKIARSFRFVANESLAAEQDDESEEDLLVASRAFDLATLIEDEVLMDLPLVPRHDVCPIELKLSSADADFDDNPTPPNRFAKLAQLNTSKQN